MEKKYELTSNCRKVAFYILYQIKALKDFADVKKGDLGGWIASEDNLDQEGNAWVYDNACVFNKAKVCQNAVVKDNARVLGDAKLYQEAKVYGKAIVTDNALITDFAEVFDEARICDTGVVYGYGKVFGNAEISGNAKVFDNAQVSGFVNLTNRTYICANGKIEMNDDFFFNEDGNYNPITFFRCADDSIKVCYYGEEDEDYYILDEDKVVFGFDEFLNIAKTKYTDKRNKLLPLVCQMAKIHICE